MSNFSWDELPEIHEVRQALVSQAELKARLKIAKLELEIYQAELVQRKPRDSSVKVVGVDAESKAQLDGLLRRVVEIESQLDMMDADVKFHQYRLESARIMSYKGRA